MKVNMIDKVCNEVSECVYKQKVERALSYEETEVHWKGNRNQFSKQNGDKVRSVTTNAGWKQAVDVSAYKDADLTAV